MTGNILKYSGLGLFLLLLGLCLNRNVQSGESCVADAGRGEGESYVVNNPELDGMQMVVFPSATSIAPEEATRGGGNSHQMREVFKLLHVYLKDVICSSRQNDIQNFIHLLSARHEKGFYLYTLEKLLI